MRIRAPKFVRKLVRKKPDLLFYGGLVAIGAGTVGACVASFKAKDAIDEMTEELDDIRENKDEMEESEYNKEVTHIYINTSLKVVRYYALPLASEILGVYLLRKSHGELKKEVKELGGLLAATTHDFKTYRKRVIEKEGKEADENYRYGITEEEVREVDEEGGETVKAVRKPSRNPLTSPTSRFFDESCREWTKIPEENMAYLCRLQEIFTDRLRTDGYVFLNDVYAALGMPKTELGHMVGWVYTLGEGYVDFGITDIYSGSKAVNDAKKRFVNGYENVILLDFNTDGYIINEVSKIGW